MKTGLILLSGGMDSTTLLYEYRRDIALAVSFNYGSKHNAIEIYYAKKNCKFLGIKHITIDLKFINKYFKSSLLKSGPAIPEGHYQDESMKSTVVPFRNGIMLSIAAGLAESHGLRDLFIANHFGDHAIYPDCRTEFIDAMAESMYAGTYINIKTHSPYCDKTKREIALLGQELKVDYSQTYSCYKGEADFVLFGVPFNDKHCGVCGTCIERKEALQGFDETFYIDEYQKQAREGINPFPFQ